MLNLKIYITSILFLTCVFVFGLESKPRVIVTTDGEADDRASMVRFLLTSNEFEVEGMINSSSQFHWQGGTGWNALHPVEWLSDYIDLYGQVYNNLKLHDDNFPSPEYLKSVRKVGNISAIGEDDIRTDGANWIAQVLLDSSDPRPIYLQAWGGVNTISRALKIIQEDHPERMEEVAAKMKLYLIWEQDPSYQEYIRSNWEHLGMQVIIADQFDCMAYIWNKVLPGDVQEYFRADFVNTNIKTAHGALCNNYVVNNDAFNAEGDTPAFLYAIPTGLRSTENPGFGGWGGRFVNVRNNVWMDTPPTDAYTHPNGQISIHNSWSKMMENWTSPSDVAIRDNYFKSIWRWLDDVQNEFAARADWCVMDYASANHHPIVKLTNTPLEIQAKPGEKIELDASESSDPDCDELFITWWYYEEAGTYSGIPLPSSFKAKTTVKVPDDAEIGDTIHIICEVSDAGLPSLTRYQRVVIRVY